MTTTELPAEGDGWETVTDEAATQIELEQGEIFTGIKVGEGEAEFKDGKTGPVYFFRAAGAQGGEDGVEDRELCSMIGSYKLRGISDIPDGHLVRITRMKDVPMKGNGRQPMKDYKVQSRAVPAARS